MFILAHLSYPLLIFLPYAWISGLEYSGVHLAVLALFSILPDVDELVAVILGRNLADVPHRRWLSHKPIMYTPILVWALAWPSLFSLLALFGILMHFFLDNFASSDGMQWAYPFSKRYINWYGEKFKGLDGMPWLRVYAKQPMFKMELVASILAAGILIVRFV